MLVKRPGQFVCIFTIIEFLSNQALNEQNKWKTEIFMFTTWNQRLEFIKQSLDSPIQFSEVFLTNELRCAHNHHQTRIKFHTHPLVLGEEKFIKNLLR
jgi:hypothetical protein